jgi:phosphoglycolate phosphatase
MRNMPRFKRTEPMLKLVVFDCDGVLFDSREANRVYYNDLLVHFGCPPMSEAEIEYVHMHNVADSIRYIFRNHGRISMEEASRYSQSLDYAPYLRHMIMAPDLHDFLKIITPRCHRAISTNRTTSMDLILDLFGLREHFEIVMTAASVPRPKPAPDALHVILRHFGLTADEAVFIGDSSVDQGHAAAAGVDLIAFNNPSLDARWHVSSFMEILELPPFAALGLTA